MRVELRHLVPVFPCFSEMTLSFIQAPFADMSLKLGSFDIMNLGLFGNVGSPNALNFLLKKVIQNICQYPKVKRFNTLQDAFLLRLSMNPPKGLLHLKVEKGINLPFVRFTSPNPSLLIESGQQTLCTSTQTGSSNPVWNESFDIHVLDAEHQNITFTVHDDDIFSNKHVMGTCVLNLMDLASEDLVGRPQRFVLDVQDVSSGGRRRRRDSVSSPRVSSPRGDAGGTVESEWAQRKGSITAAEMRAGM
jgi:Ca2+-dependent lipid-binding protein